MNAVNTHTHTLSVHKSAALMIASRRSAARFVFPASRWSIDLKPGLNLQPTWKRKWKRAGAATGSLELTNTMDTSSQTQPFETFGFL